MLKEGERTMINILQNWEKKKILSYNKLKKAKKKPEKQCFK